MRTQDRFLSAALFGTVVLYALVELAASQGGHTICDFDGCNCTELTGGWRNVNCILADSQELDLSANHIPKKITEFYITGGQRVTFSTKTFDELSAIALMRLENIRKVVFTKWAAYTIRSPSLLVQVLNCDVVHFSERAFDDMQGSLSTEIIATDTVHIEKLAFSNLINCTMLDVSKVYLESQAFDIKNIATSSRHGPVTVLLFINVGIGNIQEAVFVTSLAQLVFRDSRIDAIKSNAFRSIQISEIEINNCTVGVIESKAITERTLVVDFRINKCQIAKLQTEAITTGMTKITVNHSTITDIESRSIVSTAAHVDIVGNQIRTFHSTAVVISKWNRIAIDQNVIRNLHADFIVAPWNEDVQGISFKGNEIYRALDNSLGFVSKLNDPEVLVFDDNFFNQSCSCEMEDWVEAMTNATNLGGLVLDTSFCTIDQTLSRCFSLPVEIINMQNFTEKACTNHTVCEPYNGETRTINTTGKIFADHDSNEKQDWLIFVVVLAGFIALLLVGTFVAIMIRGGRWLKRKVCPDSGYLRNSNDSHDEEENTIVTNETENEKLVMPEELTMEFLHELSSRLDDPTTHQEASEMIERLYEMFVVDDSYENNNREEEAHLYEELGNLNLQIPPPPYEEQPSSTVQGAPSAALGANSGPRGILRLMEEKFGGADSSKSGLDSSTSSTKPILSGDYCEPIDRDVHLYSELKEKDEGKRNSVRSNGSNTMALRPLPDKPEYRYQPGPSTKL
ncbi:ben isoform X1 [Rhynchophorus ferrugineus]|uniref:ben isoform X1 n=1 Tax=Rhynchophorus ferrugineus TaxID=354439 RepID=UPI003FCD355F